MFGFGTDNPSGPVDLDGVCSLLNGLELKYRAIPEKNAITLSFDADNGDVDLVLLVNKEAAVVYIAAVEFLKIPEDHPRFAEIMRRFMELNWELSLGKFEWDPKDGEVRLSYAFTTEDGLGQNALGAAIAYIVKVADKRRPELKELVGE
jgi:hypothetical protein